MGGFLFDFYWHNHCICHHFCNIWRVILMTLKYASSRSSRIKVIHRVSRKPIGGFLYLTSFESNILSNFIFEIFDEKVLWPRFRTVQGHPRSKVMVPISSPWVIFYSTSIDTIIVCVTIFLNIWRVILMTLNQHSSRSSKVKDHYANRKPIGGFLYDLHCVQHCWTQCSTQHSRYLIWKFGDLDLRRFKVIQGRRWWCQLIAHGWLSVRLPMIPTSYLSPFLKYLPNVVA